MMRDGVSEQMVMAKTIEWRKKTTKHWIAQWLDPHAHIQTRINIYEACMDAMGDINVIYVCDCTGFYLSLNYICTFVSSPQRNIILERKQTFMYTVHTHTTAVTHTKQ